MVHIETADDFTKIKANKTEDLNRLKKSLKEAGLYSVRHMIDRLNYNNLDPTEKKKRLVDIEREMRLKQNQINDLEEEIEELESEARELERSNEADFAIKTENEDEIKRLISRPLSILEKVLSDN